MTNQEETSSLESKGNVPNESNDRPNEPGQSRGTHAGRNSKEGLPEDEHPSQTQPGEQADDLIQGKKLEENYRGGDVADT